MNSGSMLIQYIHCEPLESQVTLNEIKDLSSIERGKGNYYSSTYMLHDILC